MYTLAAVSTDEVVAGGAFLTAGGQNSRFFARYSFTGIPWVARQPAASVSVQPTQTVTLTATPATGYSAVRVQWQRNGAPVANGPAGASTSGGIVSGASLTLPTPTNGTPSTLTITNAQPSDSGLYTALFLNDCGSATTQSARVTVGTVCNADFDGNGTLAVHDVLDFVASVFAVPVDLRADFNSDGRVSIQDIFDFLGAYFAGC